MTHSLILRCVNSEMKSARGFKYPRRGKVICPDWNPTPRCGNGLHGWLKGEGNPDNEISGFSNVNDDSLVWLVIKAKNEDIITIDNNEKCKFREGYVVFSGKRHDAISYMVSKNGAGPQCNWITLSGRDNCVLSGGKYSTLNGGFQSILVGGDYSFLIGEHNSTLTGGNFSNITGGNFSKLTGRHNSFLKGGNFSVLTGGCSSTLKGGENSALVGEQGSIFSSGACSSFLCKYWEGGYYRFSPPAYVEENGIEVDVPYKFHISRGIWMKA